MNRPALATGAVGLAVAGLLLTRTRSAKVRNDRTRDTLREARNDAAHWWNVAHHDDLTGLRNRRSLYTDWDSYGPNMFVAILDIDGFKAVNDDYGHAVGDHLLLAIAERLNSDACPGRAYRLGGDEFALILDDADHALWLPVELSAPIRLSDWDGAGIDYHPSISIGIAPWQPNRSAAMADADELMYADKALKAITSEAL